MIKYGDLVRVKEGFYEGCKGIAVDYSTHTKRYEIEITKIIRGREFRKKTIVVPKNSVEIVK